MPVSKEIQEQMRKKVFEIYQSGKGYKAISKALGLQRTTLRESKRPLMKETWESGEPSQERPANQNYPTSAVTPNPRGQKRP